MQTKGWNFSNAITYGRAGYVATGRGYQVDTVSVPELYSKYAQSHIYLAFEIAFYLVVFQVRVRVRVRVNPNPNPSR